MSTSITKQKNEALSISLPAQLKRDLLKRAQNDNVAVSQVVAEALKKHLILKEWRDLQDIFGPALLKLGIDSDEAVEEYFG